MEYKFTVCCSFIFGMACVCVVCVLFLVFWGFWGGDFNLSNRCIRVLLFVVCSFLKTSDVAHPFICLFPIHISLVRFIQSFTFPPPI